MIALIKMTNWHQIEISLDSPEDLEKLKIFIDEGRVVIIGHDKETIMDEDALEVYGTIIE